MFRPHVNPSATVPVFDVQGSTLSTFRTSIEVGYPSLLSPVRYDFQSTSGVGEVRHSVRDTSGAVWSPGLNGSIWVQGVHCSSGVVNLLTRRHPSPAITQATASGFEGHLPMTDAILLQLHNLIPDRHISFGVRRRPAWLLAL